MVRLVVMAVEVLDKSWGQIEIVVADGWREGRLLRDEEEGGEHT